MKKLSLIAVCSLLSTGTYAQSFQLGFFSGIMANYPATTPNLSADQTAYARNTNVLTGLSARYDTRKRWSAIINASTFSKSFYETDAIKEDPSPSNPNNYGIHILETYATDCTFYLLDFGLQYNLNSKAALNNPAFKGIKSYIGISYTAIQATRLIRGTSYDIVNNYQENIKWTYNPNYRALGLSYYAAYNVNQRFVLSLNVYGRINTEDLKHRFGKVEYNELDPDYYLSTALGIAYRFIR